MFVKHLNLFCLNLLLLSGFARAVDFPAPPSATVESIASSVTSLGMTLNIRRFTSEQNIPQILNFYRNLWGNEANEVIMKPWTMIGNKIDGQYYNVQIQTSGDHSWGYLSISDLPEQIDNKTLKAPSAQHFPKMSGSAVMDNQVSKDPGKKGRTVMLSNDFSVQSNHNYYRNHFLNNGWKIIMDEQTHPRQASYAMYATKGADSYSITIHQQGNKTIIVANEVKKGLLR